jgi:hypothetical protein
MSAPDPRELRRATAILRALGMALIYVPGDLWAVEVADSPGAGRWPQSGGESWENILRFIHFRNRGDKE